MARAKAQKNPTVVTITTNWQLAFIVALVAASAVSTGQIIYGMVRLSHYVSSGTLMVQTSMWVYPILYLAIAWLFVQRRIRGTVPRLFWAILVTAIGMSIYGIVSTLSQVVMWETHYTITGDSVWSAFGVNWTVMGIMLVLYCVALGVIAKRHYS